MPRFVTVMTPAPALPGPHRAAGQALGRPPHDDARIAERVRQAMVLHGLTEGQAVALVAAAMPEAPTTTMKARRRRVRKALAEHPAGK